MVNFNGVKNKQALLQTAADYIKPDVIIGSETKLAPHINNAEFLPPNYCKNTFRKDRNGKGKEYSYHSKMGTL